MSIRHSGVVKIDFDKGLEDWLTFTEIKKWASDRCILVPKISNLEKYERWKFTQDLVVEFCRDADEVAVEDYAYGSAISRGRDLAEYEGWIKQSLYRMGKKLFTYPPTRVKKTFSGSGNADKLMMWDAYCTIEGAPDLSSLPIVSKPEGAPGTSDVVDAFAVAWTRMLESEKIESFLEKFSKSDYIFSHEELK